MGGNNKFEMDIWTAALEGCQEEVLRILTSHQQGSIHQPKANPNQLNENGFAPIHYAAMLGHDPIVVLLLQYGALVDLQDLVSLDTPLHKAVRSGHIGIAKVLLTEGCDVTLLNAEGKSALDIAVGRFDSEMAAILTQAPVSRTNKSTLKKAASSYQIGAGNTPTKLKRPPSHYQTFCEIPLATMKQMCTTGDNYREQAAALSTKTSALEQESERLTSELSQFKSALAQEQDEIKKQTRVIRLMQTDAKNSAVKIDYLVSENVELRRAKQNLERLEVEHHLLHETRKREQNEHHRECEHWKDQVRKLRDRETVLERKVDAMEQRLTLSNEKIAQYEKAAGAKQDKPVEIAGRKGIKPLLNVHETSSDSKNSEEARDGTLSTSIQEITDGVLSMPNTVEEDIPSRLRRTEEQFAQLKASIDSLQRSPIQPTHNVWSNPAPSYIPTSPPTCCSKNPHLQFHHHRRQSVAAKFHHHSCCDPNHDCCS